MTTGSLAILMIKLHYVIPILPFKPQALVFKFTTNVLDETNACDSNETYSIMFAFSISRDIQHSIVQILFLIAGLEFTLCDHHNLLVLFMNYRVVRVISAARFENTWPAHSANFEYGMGFVKSVW